jgi:hypothetical protein
VQSEHSASVLSARFLVGSQCAAPARACHTCLPPAANPALGRFERSKYRGSAGGRLPAGRRDPASAGRWALTFLDNVHATGHTHGMTMEKLAVSLPRQVAERARRAVRRGHAASVSAYVTRALEEKVKLDDLSTLLGEMLAETGGPLTTAERRAADRLLGVATRPARRKRRR